MNKKIGYIIYRKQAFFLFIAICAFGCICGIISLNYINSRLPQILSMIIIFLPFIFIKKVFNYYGRRVSFKFENSSMEVIVIDGKEMEKRYTYLLTEIEAYQIQFPNQRFADIMFKLKSGKKIPFSFYINKNKAENIDTDALINYFHDFIKNYNQSSAEKIKLLPSFFATKGGIISIISLISLFVADIIVHIVLHKMGILPISLFLVLGIIIQVLLQRNKDLKYYNKMK